MARTLLLPLALIALPTVALGQADRRQPLRTPGLVLETGAPSAATRALTFTSDGSALVAAGEDKVVRVWPFANGKLDKANGRTLRWQTWHEWRGSIYCMALSHDAEQKYVAVAGYGGYTGAIAVIERATGKVVAGLQPPREPLELGKVTWSLDFAPGGEEVAFGKGDGSVWVWAYTKKGDGALRRVGSHGERKGGGSNRVGFLAYLGEGQLLSIAEDGRALAWPAGMDKAAPEERFRAGVPNPIRFTLSADGRWIALAGHDSPKANRVEVWSADGRTRKTLELPAEALASALALSPDGKRLLAAVELSPAGGKTHQPKRCSVWVCDLAGDGIGKADEVPASFYVDAIAFHPKGQYAAVAGGNDHELVVYDLTTRKPVAEARSPGTGLWAVGLSKDGGRLGYRTRRNANPIGFDDWGAGDWAVFDLKGRRWAADAKAFQPVEPVTTLDGWRLEARTLKDWYVVKEGGEPQPLPIDTAVDGLPTCFTFLQPPGGVTQLAVGHKWGFTVFALDGNKPRRLRVGYGHAGEVTAMGPSADHKLLVTASRDQTVCAFSLEPWANQREIGASFAREGDRVLVGEVADGSPAWEAGLSPGDEIVFLAYDGAPAVKADWLERLSDPAPNRELRIDVARREVKGAIPMLTTVRQRPLWRFFPAGGEWVLWRWRDYFYDCSANGDSLIGWQVNRDVGDTPEFFKAEQFRKDRHKPEKVLQAVSASLLAPEKASIPDLLPPKVEVAVSAERVADEPLKVAIRVAARGPGAIRQPRSVNLWVNDHKFASWPALDGFDLKRTDDGDRYETTVTVPASVLRRGQKNLITAKAYNQKDVRDDSASVLVDRTGAETDGRLHGLFVGVADYSKAPLGPKGEFWPSLLFPVKDAEAMNETWREQAKSGLYKPGHFAMLTNEQATRDRVLEELAALKKAVGPNDRAVIFLAGHGWARPTEAKEVYDANFFAFACPKFDIARYEETGLSSETLYGAIVALPCRKLVLLDACHSGSLQSKGADFIRALTPEGAGPPIFSAAGRDEAALEHPRIGHGLFTRAVLDALTEDFADVDADRDNVIDATELGNFLAKRVPFLLDRVRPFLAKDERGSVQTPQTFPNLRAASEELTRPLARGPVQK